MNSTTPEREKAHRKATALARRWRCLGCRKSPPSIPCHYPQHRGMHAGKAGWSPSEWVPLCPSCHDLLDKRCGTSARVMSLRQFVIDEIEIALKGKLWPPTSDTPTRQAAPVARKTASAPSPADFVEAS